MTIPSDIRAGAISVLQTGMARDKAAQARRIAKAWSDGKLAMPEDWPIDASIDAPARPDRPEPVAPGEVPRRRLNSVLGRIALLHAIAHIELNAIDLAFDLIARFGGDKRLPEPQRRAFITDWVSVGDDEARHFVLIADRLNALDSEYGALPAHGGLWEAAGHTAHDLAARLAVAPLVLEARGLDVTPNMIERLKSAGDPVSADLLSIIYREEIGHVRAGMRWFKVISGSENRDPQTYYQELVRLHFKGLVKPPFNFDARDQAGFPADFYEALAVTGPPLA
jgi:uncharacterized ferritin-like protein (DUF455 family)